MTYITLHYITLHYITLHYITLHYITLHYITLHYITLHHTTPHHTTPHHTTPHHTTPHHTTPHHTTSHHITLHYTNGCLDDKARVTVPDHEVWVSHSRVIKPNLPSERRGTYSPRRVGHNADISVVCERGIRFSDKRHT